MSAPRRRPSLSDLVCLPPAVRLRDLRPAEEIRAADREEQRRQDAWIAEHNARMAQYRQDYDRDRAEFRAWLEQYQAETERIRAEHQHEKQEWELRHAHLQREHDALTGTRRTGDST